VQQISDRAREEWLDAAVAVEVGRGGRVESRTPGAAVIVFGRPVNHTAHVLAPRVLLWLPVWVLIAATQRERRVTIRVDQHGQVARSVTR
jgi:hypothetical protein